MAQDRLRIPPQNIDSERALLGAIMLRPDVFSDVLDIISPDAFYAEKHRLIYQIMLELFSKKEPIDLLSTATRLKDRQVLDQIGGNS